MSLYRPNNAKKFKEKSDWYYLDPFRLKQIKVTPEETVRQDMLQHLVESLGVPAHRIRVEEPLCHFKKAAKGRADIIILSNDPEEEELRALCVVECKRPAVPITDQTSEQAIRYANICKAKYYICTNGEEEYAFRYDGDGFFEELKEVPTYEEMCAGAGVEEEYAVQEEIPMEEAITRTDFYVNEIGAIGESSQQVSELGIKIFESFMRMPFVEDIDLNRVTVEDDHGVVFWTIGNTFLGYTTTYRVFCVKYNVMLHRHIFLTTAGMCSADGVSSILMVGIQDHDQSRSALMLNLDNGTTFSDGKVTIRHNGRLARSGKKGLRQKVFEVLKEIRPDLIEGDMVNLGTLDATKMLWTFEDRDFANFIGNLIEYAIIRDEVQKGGDLRGILDKL